MNVLILTISFFVVFVVGMFTGREMLYLAEGRQRKAKKNKPPVVAGGYMHDKSKHWPKEDNDDQ